jgi:hypothetical protein
MWLLSPGPHPINRAKVMTIRIMNETRVMIIDKETSKYHDILALRICGVFRRIFMKRAFCYKSDRAFYDRRPHCVFFGLPGDQVCFFEHQIFSFSIAIYL